MATSYERCRQLLQQLEVILTTSNSSSSSSSSLNHVLVELIQAIGPMSSSLPMRLDVIKSFMSTMNRHKLNLFPLGDIIDKLWINTRDLFDKSKVIESKMIATHFLCTILDQHHHISTSNHNNNNAIQSDVKSGIIIDMFTVLTQVDSIECALRFKALRSITNHVSNITFFSPELLVDTLLHSVQSSKLSKDYEECLTFLMDILTKSFTSLPSHTVTQVIEFVARLLMNPRVNTQLIFKSLNIYECIVNHGGIPPDHSMVTFCSAMCQTVNYDTTNKSLEVMNRVLLESHYKQRAFQSLIDIMNHSQVHSLYRGSIFFVTMATWGKHKSDVYRDAFSTVLYAMLKTMSCNVELVSYEISLSIGRLIKTFAKELRMEWDVIIEILMKMDVYLQLTSSSSLKQSLQNTLLIMNELYKSGDYFGNDEDYIKLMQLYKDILPIHISIEILNFMKNKIHPAYMNWLSDLRHVIEVFFIHDTRIAVNEKVLEIIRFILWQFTHITDNSSIFDILLPFFNQITTLSHSTDDNDDNDNDDHSISLLSLTLLIDVAKELTFNEKRYDHLAQILYKCVVNGNSEEFRLRAICGMIDVFHVKFKSLPCNEALSLYTCLLKVLDHKDSIIRERAIDCLLSIRADHSYKLQLRNVTSPYLRCHSRNLIRTISFVLPVSNLIDALLDRVTYETDYPLFSKIIVGIRDILLNFYLLKEPPIWRVCTVMCNVLKRRFEFIMMTNSTTTTATTNTATTTNHQITTTMTTTTENYIHVLRIILGYNVDEILSYQQRQALIDCFIYAMDYLFQNYNVTTSSLLIHIIDSLTIATTEMPDVINNVFYSILLSIMRIENVVLSEQLPLAVQDQQMDLIISAISFLHNSSIFIEKQLRHDIILDVFDFLITFTDVNKYTDSYITMMTYRTMMSWFISCNFATRQTVIKKYLPVLYNRMSHMRCTQAETAIDFFVKFAYLSCDQTLQMNDQMKKIFNNGPYQAWSTGNSILTAQAGHFNYIMLRYRRPTGTIAWTMKLVNSIRHRSSDDMINQNLISLSMNNNNNNNNNNNTNSNNNMNSGNTSSSSSNNKKLNSASINDPTTSTTNSTIQQTGNRKNGSRSNSNVGANVTSSQMSKRVSETELSTLSSSAEIDSLLKSESTRSLSPTFFDHENFMRITQSPIQLIIDDNTTTTNNNNNSTTSATIPVSTSSSATLPSTATSQLTSTIERNNQIMIDEQRSRSSSFDQMLTLQNTVATTPTTTASSNINNISTDYEADDDIFQFMLESTSAENEETSLEIHPLPSYDEESSHSPPFYSVLGDTMIQRIDSTASLVESQQQQQQQQQPSDSAFSSNPIVINSRSRAVSSVVPATTTTPQSNVSYSSSVSTPLKNHRSLPYIDQNAISPLTTTPTMKTETPDGSKRKPMNFKDSLTQLKTNLVKRKSSLPMVPRFSPKDSSQTGKSTLRPLSSSFTTTTTTVTSTNNTTPGTTTAKTLFEREGALHPNFPYLFLRNWPFLSQEEPHGLQHCDSLTRALNMIDYIPSVETAKFALLYVSEGQSTEQQILKNTFGSHRYFRFLQQIGDFVSLKDQQRLQQEREKNEQKTSNNSSTTSTTDDNHSNNNINNNNSTAAKKSSGSNEDDEEDSATSTSASTTTTSDNGPFFSEGLLYTGGLDLSSELADGEYALIYRDDICHVVFHAATMMPNLRHDEKFSNKKRHIGNDYVTIVYSDNDSQFNPNVITGQFNVVHIVIYPLEEGFNRVEVKLRENSGLKLPRFGPLGKSQIVSDQALSSVVRLTAIHADLAARACRKANGEFVSNWEERLRQIHVIKSRFSKAKSTSGNDKSDLTTTTDEEIDVALLNAMNDFFE